MVDKFKEYPAQILAVFTAFVAILVVLSGIGSSGLGLWARETGITAAKEGIVSTIGDVPGRTDLAETVARIIGGKAAEVIVRRDEGRESGEDKTSPAPDARSYTPPGTTPVPGRTSVPREMPAEIPISDEVRFQNLFAEAQRFWDKGDVDKAWVSLDAALVYQPDNAEALALLAELENAAFTLQSLLETDIADTEDIMTAAEAVLQVNPEVEQAKAEWDAAAIRWREECRWTALAQWANNLWLDQKQPFPADEAVERLANVELQLIDVSGWAAIRNRNDVADLEAQRPGCCPELSKFTFHCPRWFLSENVEGSPGKGSIFFLESAGTWYPPECKLPVYRAPRKPRATSTPIPKTTPTPSVSLPDTTAMAGETIQVTLEIYPVNTDGQFETCSPITMYVRGTAPADSQIEVYCQKPGGSEWKLVNAVTSGTDGQWSFQFATNVWGKFVAISSGQETPIWDHHPTCP